MLGCSPGGRQGVATATALSSKPRLVFAPSPPRAPQGRGSKANARRRLNQSPIEYPLKRITRFSTAYVDRHGVTLWIRHASARHARRFIILPSFASASLTFSTVDVDRPGTILWTERASARHDESFIILRSFSSAHACAWTARFPQHMWNALGQACGQNT